MDRAVVRTLRQRSMFQSNDHDPKAIIINSEKPRS